LDQCVGGLPMNVSTVSTFDDGAPRTQEEVEAILATWRKHMGGKGCLNVTVCADASEAPEGQDCMQIPANKADITMPVEDTVPAGGMHNAPVINTGFALAPKCATNTVRNWFVCRLGVSQEAAMKASTTPDTYRATVVRQPSKRSQSGFFQMLSHWMVMMRMPPDDLATCLKSWPANLQDDAHTSRELKSMSGFPDKCKESWLTNAVGKELKEPEMSMQYHMAVNMQSSKMLKSIWEDLSCSCRVLFPTLDGKTYRDNGKEWTYEAKSWYCENDGSKCTVSQETIGQMYAYALADQQLETMTPMGCQMPTYAGEHMHPFHGQAVTASRIDFVLKLESMTDDMNAFEDKLKELGHPMPALKDPNCTFENMHDNAEEPALDEELYDPHKLEYAIGNSTDLQRRICLAYVHDYLCYGYAMPTACDDMDSWAEETSQRLLNGDPVIYDNGSSRGA